MTRDDDLEKRVDELQRSLEELREELRERERDRWRPRRGPGGLPRPPTPRELVRFADREAIPAAIATLEANIRALELLQGALRLADPERAAAEEAERTRARAEDLGHRGLDRLDDALRDLQEAARGEELPRDSNAREIIEQARRIRAEIAEGIDAAERERARDRRDPGGEDGETADRGVEIDVEDELDSIRAELEDDEDGDATDTEDGTDAAGDDAENGEGRPDRDDG
jgi:hypothetical protein